MMRTQPFFAAVNAVRDALFGNEAATDAPQASEAY